MLTKVKKIGNSLGVHIPKTLATKACLTDGTPIIFEYKNNTLMIRRIKKEETLQDLLKRVTPENTHEFISFGDDVDREIVE